MANEKAAGQSMIIKAAPTRSPGSVGKKDVPEVLAILPLRNAVFFPGGVLPLAIGRAKTITLIKDAVRDDLLIGVVTQRRAEEEDPGPTDLFAMGTVARIVKLMKLGEDNYSLVVQGLTRFRLLELIEELPYLKARVEGVEDAPVADVEAEALAIVLKKLAFEVIELMPELPAAAGPLVESINHPGHLADLISANIDISVEQKQAVLETVDLKARMRLVVAILSQKRETLTVAKEILARVRVEVSETQRQDYLREQLRVIQEMLAQRQPTTKACSFCGKRETEVKKLIAGPAVAVCNECIVRFAGPV